MKTAALLGKKLRTHDEYDCREPSGTPVPGEPDWDYACTDITHPERQGYLVQTNDKRITAIQPTG